ncbi:MAG: acyl-CoA dehydrogenase family protein [Solirubrobacteraceae bacterium]
MAAAEDSERTAWREANRGFIARRYPISAVREQLERPRVLDRPTWRASCEMGWLAVLLGAAEGGLGGDPELVVSLAEELGRAVNPAPLLGCGLSAAVIARDPSLDRDVLARLLDGTLCCAWCLLEGDGPWSAEAVHAVTEATGRTTTLTASKVYVIDADLADVLLLTVRDGGGLRNFLLPVSAPGVRILTARGLDLTRRLSRVELDAVTLAEHPRADPTTVESAVRHGLRLGATLCCADAVGVAERLLEMTVAYATDREAFGRPLAGFQAVKHACANMLCTVEGARVATQNAARHLGLGDGVREPIGAEAERRAEWASSVSKGWVGEACARLAGQALQLHGGIGFTWEHDLHLYLRRAHADAALFGSSAWHRDRLGAEVMRAAS